jgi:hypothetical protein
MSLPKEAQYIAGSLSASPGPLSRYLPPLPDGIVTDWLASQSPSIPQGAWILDPFGASPRTAVELARAGFRVLVAANNPVARFLIEMAAHPPLESEFRAALADLATARKGDERIEPHLRALYATECARCGRSIMADAFLWERDAVAPYARLYTCPNCGDSGEHPTTPSDAERATIAIAGLHRTRALERVAPLNDPDRPNAEEALAAYPPRAVYALFTLINKLDGLNLSPLRRRCLQALLLSTCDQANTLWAYPTTRERPKHLGIPPRYRENNIWLALEASIPLWATGASVVPLVTWPKQPETENTKTGCVCVFVGRLRDLAADLQNIRISAVVAALPRPNQAFWTLSALWAGWLWGREAVGPFKAVLRRRRYDWAWHTTALASALKALTEHLPAGIPFLGLIGELESGFLKAASIAADVAGFDLHRMVLRDEYIPAYLEWVCAGVPVERPVSESIVSLIQSAAEEYLIERGEPADYLHLVAAALQGLSSAHAFWLTAAATASSEKVEDHPADLFNQTQNAIREVFTYRGGFLRYGATEAFDTGQWWLQEAKNTAVPLADRVEMELVRFLIHHPGSSFEDIDRNICKIFPGIFTPGLDLLQVCLDSYGIQDPPECGHWTLRPADIPANRRVEIELIHKQLQQLAERLGYTVQDDTALVWLDTKKLPHYWFFIKASAIFSEIVLNSGLPASRTLIVLPGSRANLVVYKQRCDPRMGQIAESGWRFLKFRHLRWLLETPLLLQDNFDEQLNADPLTYTAPQQRLF